MNSSRVIAVAAATRWKRNGMKGISQSLGTAANSLYSVGQPGVDFIQAGRAAVEHSLRGQIGEARVDLVLELLPRPVVQLAQAGVGRDIEA